MPNKRRLELAYQLAKTVHADLWNKKKVQEADELRDIMRRLLLLSQKLEVNHEPKAQPLGGPDRPDPAGRCRGLRYLLRRVKLWEK